MIQIKIKYFSLIIIVLTLLLNIIFLPSVIHFLQNKKILNGKKGYFCNAGKYGMDLLIEKGISNNSSGNTYYFLPLVENNWTAEKPVNYIVMYDKTSLKQIRSGIENNNIQGIQKNILWEKVFAQRYLRKNFKNNTLKISKNCVIIDTTRSYENVIYLFVFDLVVIILLLFIKYSEEKILSKRNFK